MFKKTFIDSLRVKPAWSEEINILFKLIKKHDYKGDLIIQGARDKNENPEDTSRKYITFVKHYVDKYLK